MRSITLSSLTLAALLLAACGATGVDRELAACPTGDLRPLNPTRWHWQGQPGIAAPAQAAAVTTGSGSTTRGGPSTRGTALVRGAE